MRKLYISRSYKVRESAGGKARADMEFVVQRLGYRNIGLSRFRSSSMVVNFSRNLMGMLKVVFCMPKGGLLFLQYPIKKYYAFICNIAHLRGVKVVTLVHDLGSFRRKRLTPAHEIKRLNHSDYLLVHTSRMAQWLRENHYKGEIRELGVWDYLSRVNVENPYQERAATNRMFTVNYIGSLGRRKNSFLYDVKPWVNRFSMKLYGKGFLEEKKEEENDLFRYCGFFSDRELIVSVKGDFGLVWDGDSLDTCSGDFGSYLAYNSPHKLALYMRCHLPVIIWEGAAMASFVKKEKIGLTVSSLKELDGLLPRVTLEEYGQMKKNAVGISRRLQEGYYLEKGLRGVEQELGID